MDGYSSNSDKCYQDAQWRSINTTTELCVLSCGSPHIDVNKLYRHQQTLITLAECCLLLDLVLKICWWRNHRSFQVCKVLLLPYPIHRVSMFTPCLHEFSPGTPTSSHKDMHLGDGWIGNSQLPLCLNVGGNGYLYLSFNHYFSKWVPEQATFNRKKSWARPGGFFLLMASWVKGGDG